MAKLDFEENYCFRVKGAKPHIRGLSWFFGVFSEKATKICPIIYISAELSNTDHLAKSACP